MTLVLTYTTDMRKQTFFTSLFLENSSLLNPIRLHCNWGETVSDHPCGHTLHFMLQMIFRTLCINNRNYYDWYAIFGEVKTKTTSKKK